MLPKYPSENTGLVTLNTVRGPVGWWALYVPLTLILLLSLVIYFLPLLRSLFFGSFLPAAVYFAQMIGVQ